MPQRKDLRQVTLRCSEGILCHHHVSNLRSWGKMHPQPSRGIMNELGGRDLLFTTSFLPFLSPFYPPSTLTPSLCISGKRPLTAGAPLNTVFGNASILWGASACGKTFEMGQMCRITDMNELPLSLKSYHRLSDNHVQAINDNANKNKVFTLKENTYS